MKEATIDIEMAFKTEKESGVVYGALKPEIKSEDRTETSLRKDRNKIYLKITARDMTALRASVNSYFRWIRTSHAMLGEM